MFNVLCSQYTGVSRRSAQTVLAHTLKALCYSVAPIAPFTADDIHQHSGDLITDQVSETSNIFHSEYPKPVAEWNNPELSAKWENVLVVRDEVNKLLEKARKDKVIGSPKEARVVVNFEEPSALSDAVFSVQDEIADVLLTVRLA